MHIDTISGPLALLGLRALSHFSSLLLSPLMSLIASTLHWSLVCIVGLSFFGKADLCCIRWTSDFLLAVTIGLFS